MSVFDCCQSDIEIQRFLGLLSLPGEVVEYHHGLEMLLWTAVRDALYSCKGNEVGFFL